MHLWIFITAYLSIKEGIQTLAATVTSFVNLSWSIIFFLCSFQGLQLFMTLSEIKCIVVSVHHYDKAFLVFCKLKFITLVLMFSQQVVDVNYFLLLCNESCYIFISILLQSSEVLTSCEQFFNQVNL